MLQAVQVSYAAAVGSQAAGSGPLSSADPDILILEPGLAYPAPPNIPEVALDINIQGGLSVSLPSYELIRPLRGLASNGSIVTNSSFVEIQVFENTSPADALVFGKVFLSQVGNPPRLGSATRIPHPLATWQANRPPTSSSSLSLSLTTPEGSSSWLGEQLARRRRPTSSRLATAIAALVTGALVPLSSDSSWALSWPQSSPPS